VTPCDREDHARAEAKEQARLQALEEEAEEAEREELERKLQELNERRRRKGMVGAAVGQPGMLLLTGSGQAG